MTGLDWIAADWGTSNLRVWGMDTGDAVLFAETSDKGMSRIDRGDYAGLLSALLDKHLSDADAPLPVVICGMAGARQGWKEAAYLPLPARLQALGTEAVQPDMPDRRLLPFILPGLSDAEPGREDVMRGEETQILGLLALEPGFEGMVCLPGTHSKWVRVENGAVTRFETAMTGELFELLSTHSVLRHALAGAETGPELESGIAEGMQEGLAAPERLPARLFRTRAAALLADRPSDWCRGYLSGLLVGAEISAFRAWRLDAPVVLIGSGRLCRLYAAALDRDGAEGRAVDAETATLAGLAAARHHLPKS